MESKRVNTIVLDFSSVPRQPKMVDIHMWIRKELKFTVDQVLSIQPNGLKKMVFVELTSSDLVEKLINENGNCKNTL